MHGLEVTCIQQFFSFNLASITYPYTLIQWFSCIADKPNKDTGMWIIEPNLQPDGLLAMEILYLDSIICAAHLLGIYENFILSYNHTTQNNYVDIQVMCIQFI
jgi:hypothetical protein